MKQINPTIETSVELGHMFQVGDLKLIVELIKRVRLAYESACGECSRLRARDVRGVMLATFFLLRRKRCNASRVPADAYQLTSARRPSRIWSDTRPCADRGNLKESLIGLSLLGFWEEEK